LKLQQRLLSNPRKADIWRISLAHSQRAQKAEKGEEGVEKEKRLLSSVNIENLIYLNFH